MSLVKRAAAFGGVMLLVACSKLHTDSTAKPSEAEFVEAYHQAHESQDVQAMMKFFCWDRVTPEVRKQTEDLAKGELALKISDIGISRTSEPLERMRKLSYVKDGVTYRFNLSVVAALAVRFQPLPKEIESASYYAVRIKDGHYLIAVMAPSE